MSQSVTAVFPSLDLDGIERFAQTMVDRLSSGLSSGLVVGLVGTLGAGKTTLVQAIARAAEIDSAEVTSPTFTLLQTHCGKITIHHLDAYRLSDEDEFLALGVDELFEDSGAWSLIEWADRVESVMPRDTLWIKIDIQDDGQRKITVESTDAAVVQAFGNRP